MIIEHDGVSVIWRDDVGGTHRKAYDKGQFYEQPLLNRIRSLEKRGTYVDVGGNIGNHTVFFARFCRAEKVMTFEPSVRALSFLHEHVQLNGIADTVDIYEFGLSDTKGTSSFKFRGRREVEIETRVFDDEFEGIDDVTIMKLDTEGSEPAILAGSRSMIRRCTPIIFSEANTDESFLAVARVLKPLGYEYIQRVSKTGSPMFEFSTVPIKR